MKSIISALILFTLILLSSYTAISQEQPFFIMKTFTINENSQNTETQNNPIKTFEVAQEPSGKTTLINAIMQTKEKRKRNLQYNQRDEEIEECIKKITKNWKITHYKLSYERIYEEDELVEEKTWLEEKYTKYGYDKDTYQRLKFNLRNKALNGEKIC